MEHVVKGIVIGLGAIALIFIIGALFALPVMWLMNYLFTPVALMAVFGTAKIGFWQAWALAILTGFLFKSTSSSKS